MPGRFATMSKDGDVEVDLELDLETVNRALLKVQAKYKTDLVSHAKQASHFRLPLASSFLPPRLPLASSFLHPLR